MRGPSADPIRVTALFRNFNEIAQGAGKEPAEPDTGTLAANADAVHAVVPVTAEDQRQAVLPGAMNGKIERQRRVFVERRGFVAGFRLEESVVLAGHQRRPLQEGNALIQNGDITGRRNILVDRISKPYHVVRDSGADTGACQRQPPVLNVAFRELPAGCAQDLLASEIRLVEQERQGILKLVTEAEGAARLIEGRARQNAARQRLVGQPIVDHVVEAGIRRGHL